MRTTITIEADVMDHAKKLMNKWGRSFKAIINEALRLGIRQLEHPTRKPYKTRSRQLGLRQGYSLDNIQELISQTEGEEHK